MFYGAEERQRKKPIALFDILKSTETGKCRVPTAVVGLLIFIG